MSKNRNKNTTNNVDNVTVSTLHKLPKELRSINQNRFRWVSPTGVGVEVPGMIMQSPKKLKVLQDAENAEGIDAFNVVTILADDEKNRLILEDLPPLHAVMFMNAYVKSAGALSGKSSAPASS